jgi:hypothetical protein
MKKFGHVKTRGIIGVRCDRCRKSIHVDDSQQPWDYYASLSVTGGYFSPVLPDGIKTEAELWEACWVIARKALEEIGVKFIDTEYM